MQSLSNNELSSPVFPSGVTTPNTSTSTTPNIPSVSKREAAIITIAHLFLEAAKHKDHNDDRTVLARVANLSSVNRFFHSRMAAIWPHLLRKLTTLPVLNSISHPIQAKELCKEMYISGIEFPVNALTSGVSIWPDGSKCIENLCLYGNGKKYRLISSYKGCDTEDDNDGTIQIELELCTKLISDTLL